MSRLYGLDVSQFQGDINWDQLNQVSNFVIIRAAYGTLVDPKFGYNRGEAHRVQASAGPLGVGYYYYAYARLLDSITSANYFCDVVEPLSEGDVLALDWEEPYTGDHVAWCKSFLDQVYARTGVKPLIYLNQSLMNSHNWQPVIDGGYGLWLAVYGGDKDEALPKTPWPTVAMVQWTSSDFISGVSGKVDGDTFYGDFAAFAKYGHVAPPEPAEEPQPMPVPLPTPAPPPLPPIPVPPAPQPGTDQTPVPANSAGEPSMPTPNVPSSPSFLNTELTIVTNWFGTTFGKLVLKGLGAALGWVSVNSGVLHINAVAASLIGVVLGSTISDVNNPTSPNKTTSSITLTKK